MISSNQKKEIALIEKDFVLISKYFQKRFGIFWWFLNITRIDLALWGMPIKESLRNELINKSVNCLRLLFSLIVKFLSRFEKINLDKNLILIFEDFKLSKELRYKEDYYFKGIRKHFPNYINIILGLKIYKDKKNYSILQLSKKKDVLIILFRSMFLYIKYLLIKNWIFKKTKRYNFWKNYHKKNSFINFFLSSLIYNFLTKNYNVGKKLIYPYEEKPYERAINSIQDKKFKKKIFAYQVNPKDHLGLYMNNFFGIHIPRSQNYLFPGNELAKNFFKKKRKNSIKIDKSIIGTFKSKKKLISKDKIYDFLVLISHPIEYELISSWLLKLNESRNLKFLIRFYPAANLKSFKLIKEKNFFYSKNDLLKDCSLSKVAIFCNTSAGIEAVNYGLIAIWADLTLKNLSPLSEKQIKHFLPSYNFEQFKKNLSKIARFKKKEFIKKQKKQSMISNSIYSNININNINFILKEN